MNIAHVRLPRKGCRSKIDFIGDKVENLFWTLMNAENSDFFSLNQRMSAFFCVPFLLPK
jgi:hypothetical protein